MKFLLLITLFLCSNFLQVVYSSQCADKLPNCPEFTNEIAKTSGNVSLHKGQSANFGLTVNTSVKPTFQVYINKCGDDSICNIGDYTVNCSIKNVMKSTSVDFQVFTNSGMSPFNCTKTLWLIVKEPPKKVEVKDVVRSCDEVEVVINNSDIANDTEIMATLHNGDHVFNSSLNGSDIKFPAKLINLLYDDLNVSITPSNPSGTGPSTIVPIPNIYNIEVELDKNLSLYAYGKNVTADLSLQVSVNNGCLFAPDQLLLRSDCLSLDDNFLSLEKTSQSTVSLTLPMKPFLRNKTCNITMRSADEKGRIIAAHTIKNVSTNIVEKVLISNISGFNRYFFKCLLIPGSPDTGCAIVITLPNKIVKVVNLSRIDSKNEEVDKEIEFDEPGLYHVVVYNLWGYGLYDKSMALFTDDIIIDESTTDQYIYFTQKDFILVEIVTFLASLLITVIISICVSMATFMLCYRLKQKGPTLCFKDEEQLGMEPDQIPQLLNSKPLDAIQT